MLPHPGLVVYVDDEDNSVGRWNDILVVVRRRRQTLDHVKRTRDAITDFCSSSNAHLGLLHVYETTAELPDRECRRATAALLTEFGARLACAATVIEGDGIRTTMLRLAVRSLGALVDSSRRRFICSSTEEGAAWLVSALGADSQAPALLSVLASLRAGPRGASALPQAVQG
jgi:hypothetical protein